MGQVSSECFTVPDHCKNSDVHAGFSDSPLVTQLAADTPLDIKPLESKPEIKSQLVGAKDTEDLLNQVEMDMPVDMAAEAIIFAKDDDNIGDHICPITGEESAKRFMGAGMLTKLLAASQEDLGKNFSLDKDSLSDTAKGGSGGIAMAVSDPKSEDCPLVFVSSGFEDLTGYTTDHVVGRSCRFLQPTSKPMNDAINLADRKMMRSFCVEDQPIGKTIINLILNERNTGERFWNLLRMQYVLVEGEVFIFGVQTTLDAFMPKVLTKRVSNPTKNANIIASLGEFFHALEQVRGEIGQKFYTPIQELRGYASCAMNRLQLLPQFQRSSIQKTLSENDQCKPSNRSADDVAPGSIVKACQVIKYASYQAPVNTEGTIVSIDHLGNATVDWKSIGKKNVLRRDFDKLVVTMTEAEIILKLAAEDAHPAWKRLAEIFEATSGRNSQVGAKCEGAAAAHSPQAREEIVRKLISNHKAVIADVTNPSKILNVDAKSLTQPELKRVNVDRKPYVDQMLREVARRLLGARDGVNQLQEKPDPQNAVQISAWRACATYLAGRTQSKPEQKPGRKPDMSEAAAAAFLAVLEELANEAEAHPTWIRFDELLKKPSGPDKIKSVAAGHSQQARDEAARKLISNHDAVIKDVTNPSTKLNIVGKPLTQTELKRVDVDSRPYVDQMLREVARRLLGGRNGVQQLAEKLDFQNIAQLRAWRGCAAYLIGRTQSKTEQKPGREPDMSEAAAAVFFDVLEEVAIEADVHPEWKQLDDLLRKPHSSRKANGVTSDHSQQACDEAARKLISNHVAVMKDVTNQSPTMNIEGKPLTQTELKRVNVDSRPYVDQMLFEVARRLLGARERVNQNEDKADTVNADQASAWRACALYLAGRTQSKPEQKPGRKPDMSEAAAAAFLAVVKEVASEV